jgi:hypothetical protein
MATVDDEVRFVLDQHADLDFYSASSLKKQFHATFNNISAISWHYN